MTLLLLLQGVPVDTGGVQFLDETGLNPLSVGIFVSIYPSVGPQTSATLVCSGYLAVGGFFDNPNLVAGAAYTAVFTGVNAPSVPVSFRL